MKAFMRIVTVFVVLNLAMGDFALAQSASKEEMKEAKREMEVAKKDIRKASEKVREAGQKIREAGERYRHDLFTGLSRGRSTLQHSGAGRVLVIPAAETDVEDIVTMMEDMSVMSHIIDKKLDQSHTVSGRFLGSFDFGSGFPFSWGSRGTQGIYLAGYGALFLIKVDFPLAPVPEMVEEEIEKDADLVWEQTRQEIFEPTDVKRKRDYFHHEEEQEYDAEKVEELKNKLIKALKHASNIRNLKPDEWVILTVTGGDGQAVGVVESRRVSIVIKGTGMVADAPIPAVGQPSPPAVLTIRVKKSDVDAFSKGKLDFDKFRQRVLMFAY
jgi:hypothetical protein